MPECPDFLSSSMAWREEGSEEWGQRRGDLEATYQKQLNEICGQIKKGKWVPLFIYFLSPDVLSRILRMSVAKQNALRVRLSTRLPRPWPSQHLPRLCSTAGCGEPLRGRNEHPSVSPIGVL